MKLFIPELGSKLVLTRPWIFRLYAERRNLSLFQTEHDKKEVLAKRKVLKVRCEELQSLMNSDKTILSWNASPHYAEYDKVQRQYWATLAHRTISEYQDKDFAFPSKTILEVDRIYIRQGAGDFSSVSFKWRNPKTVRFWARLEEVNTINFKLV